MSNFAKTFVVYLRCAAVAGVVATASSVVIRNYFLTMSF